MCVILPPLLLSKVPKRLIFTAKMLHDFYLGKKKMTYFYFKLKVGKVFCRNHVLSILKSYKTLQFFVAIFMLTSASYPTSVLWMLVPAFASQMFLVEITWPFVVTQKMGIQDMGDWVFATLSFQKWWKAPVDEIRRWSLFSVWFKKKEFQKKKAIIMFLQVEQFEIKI